MRLQDRNFSFIPKQETTQDEDHEARLAAHEEATVAATTMVQHRTSPVVVCLRCFTALVLLP